MDTNNTNPVSNIVTLLAERGKNYDKTGEVVGFHSLSRKKTSLVFFPRGIKCEAGKEYRLELLPILEQGGQAKLDRAGNPLFNSRPAPPIVAEKWIEEAGNLLRIRTSTDWRLEEKRVALLETRKPATRETELYVTTGHEVTWSNDLPSSTITAKPEAVIANEIEAVDNGALIWKKTSERRETRPTSQYPIERVEHRPGYYGTWDGKKLEVSHDPSLTITLHFLFTRDGASASHDVTETWDSLPRWLKDELLVGNPVCSCNRKRLDPSKNTDRYSKCEICRSEEKCDRCGKQPIAVKVVNNCLICNSCRPLAEQEAIIRQHVPAEKLAELAAKAQLLLTGKVFEGETGEMVAQALLGQLKDESARREALRACAGFPWYYVHQDFVFGSKFALEAMQILCHLHQAKGNGLVRLVSWVMGSHKTTDLSGDFYTRTQVKGEEVAPSLSSWSNFSDLSVGVYIFDFAALKAKEEEEKPLREQLGVILAEVSHKELLYAETLREAAEWFADRYGLAKANNAFQAAKAEERVSWKLSVLNNELGENLSDVRYSSSNTGALSSLLSSTGNSEFGQKVNAVAAWLAQMSPQRPKGNGNGTFTLKTDRHFQCKCGLVVKVAKGDWNQFRNGGSIRVSCSCGANSWVDSSTTAKEQAKPESPKPTNAGSVSADQLAALRERFGRK